MTKLNDALAAYDCTVSGCGNHGCIVRPVRGVGTNGPCRCAEDQSPRIRRNLRAARQLRDAVAAIVNSEKEAG